MSVPRVTSHGIYCHGLGEQLKTTHTIGSPAHLEKYLCNRLRVLGGGFSLSKPELRPLDATHLSGTHSGDCPRVSACVPQNRSIHISPSKHDTSVPVCPKSCTSLSPIGPHNAGAHTPPTRQPKTTAKSH